MDWREMKKKKKIQTKQKMAGNTLTLLELYLFKQPQREKVKNNKLFFHT